MPGLAMRANWRAEWARAAREETGNQKSLTGVFVSRSVCLQKMNDEMIFLSLSLSLSLHWVTGHRKYARSLAMGDGCCCCWWCVTISLLLNVFHNHCAICTFSSNT